MRVVVAGASGPVGDHVPALRAGQLGNRVTRLLLEQLDPASLILVTRSPERLAAFADSGAEIRVGDFADRASLTAAFEGGDRLLLVALETVATHERKAIDAAADAGVGFVALTTLSQSPYAGRRSGVDGRTEIERRLGEGPMAASLLRSAPLTEALVADARVALAGGRLVHNAGDGRAAYIGIDDVAAAAATVVAGGDRDGAVYNLTGPSALAASDLAALYGELGGRRVSPVAVDDDTLVAELARRDMPVAVAEAVAEAGRAVRNGQVGRVTGDVERLTGRSPRSPRDILAGRRDELVPSAPQ